MRQCPVCSATYDDGVEFCFVDGQPLVDAGAPDTTPDIAAPAMPSSSGNMVPSPGMERVLQDVAQRRPSDPSAEPPPTPPAPTPSPPPASTPAPALVAPPGPPTPPPAPTVTPAQATPRPRPEGNFVPAPDADRGGMGTWIVAGIAVLSLLACMGFGGLGMVGSLFGGGTVPVAAPATTAAPTAAPAPPPPSAPAPVEPRTVDLTSDPDGAEVWEGGELLCVTPCKVAHEPDASLPRTFVFKRGGHEPREVVLEALGAPLRASLEKKPEPTPRPAPAAPRPSPRPAPAPAPAPVDDDDLRMTR